MFFQLVETGTINYYVAFFTKEIPLVKNATWWLVIMYDGQLTTIEQQSFLGKTDIRQPYHDNRDVVVNCLAYKMDNLPP